jgi:hypothetical protein
LSNGLISLPAFKSSAASRSSPNAMPCPFTAACRTHDLGTLPASQIPGEITVP